MSALAKAVTKVPRTAVMPRGAVSGLTAPLSSASSVTPAPSRLASTMSPSGQVMSSLIGNREGPMTPKLNAFQPEAQKTKSSSAQSSKILSALPSTIQPFNYNSLTDDAKQGFLHNVLNGMKTHQSLYDPMPTTIPSEETIREGLREHFSDNSANPDGVTLDADGSFTTNATFRWLRHANGEHNQGNWFTADAPLSSLGKGQVKDLRTNYQHALDSGLMRPADLDFCSPSLRCEDTLDPVNKINGCPRIFTHAYREQPTSYFEGLPGPSSMDPNRVLNGSVWNASGMKGKDDPWKEHLNEDHTHMDNRMWEAFGLACTTASMLSKRTGQSDTVFDISAHADCGRSFATNLCSLAGITDKKRIAELTGYYNTAMKEFDVRIRTAADGTRSLVPFEDGSLVRFGAELLPEFAKQAEAQQAAYENQYAAMIAASKASRSAQSSGLSSSDTYTKSAQSTSVPSDRSSLTSAELNEVVANAFAAKRRRSQMAPISVSTPSTASTLSTAA